MTQTLRMYGWPTTTHTHTHTHMYSYADKICIRSFFFHFCGLLAWHKMAVGHGWLAGRPAGRPPHSIHTIT